MIMKASLNCGAFFVLIVSCRSQIFFWRMFCIAENNLKYAAMKYFIMMLLFTGSMFAQERVYNVQSYCVDEKPFRKGQCDISGNEYSFVFLDTKKSEVVFFFTSMKLKYKIVETKVFAPDPNYTFYQLQGAEGAVEMKIHKQQNKIEFIYPNNHIYLTVGASTKKPQSRS
jgi:hypothetical protein